MQIIENNIMEQAIIGCAQNAYTAPIMTHTKPIKMAVAIKSDRAIFFIFYLFSGFFGSGCQWV